MNQSEQNNTFGTRYYYAASVASAPEIRIGKFYTDYIQDLVIYKPWK
jgi:hypothetical protein